jgi:hypothetical protein
MKTGTITTLAIALAIVVATGSTARAQTMVLNAKLTPLFGSGLGKNAFAIAHAHTRDLVTTLVIEGHNLDAVEGRTVTVVVGGQDALSGTTTVSKGKFKLTLFPSNPISPGDPCRVSFDGVASLFGTFGKLRKLQ